MARIMFRISAASLLLAFLISAPWWINNWAYARNDLGFILFTMTPGTSNPFWVSDFLYWLPSLFLWVFALFGGIFGLVTDKRWPVLTGSVIFLSIIPLTLLSPLVRWGSVVMSDVEQQLSGMGPSEGFLFFSQIPALAALVAVLWPGKIGAIAGTTSTKTHVEYREPQVGEPMVPVKVDALPNFSESLKPVAYDTQTGRPILRYDTRTGKPIYADEPGATE